MVRGSFHLLSQHNLVDMSSSGALGSGHNLTAEREFRYILQWFSEWSDFQREDFVPVMATYLAKGNPGGPAYVNGIISGMANVSGEDKPMSLFQCRVKLFNDWSTKWPESNREKLLEKLVEIDPDFGKRVNQELSGERSAVVDNEPSLEYFENEADSSSVSPCLTVSQPTVEQPSIALVIGED